MNLTDAEAFVWTDEDVTFTGKKYSPDQPRDERGRFGETGGGEPEVQDEAQAVKWYTGLNHANGLNHALRLNVPLTPEQEQQAKLLDEAIAGHTIADARPGQEEVFRGMVTNLKFNQGDTFIDKGFLSTTPSGDKASEFALGAAATLEAQRGVSPAGGRPLVMQIAVDPTQHYVQADPKFDEMLMPRGMQFTVQDVLQSSIQGVPEVVMLKAKPK